MNIRVSEHFFGMVRCRFGCNNNPTPYQFKATYKKILIGISSKIACNTNVEVLDSDSFVAIIPTVRERIDYVFEYYDFNNDYVENIVM